MRIIFICLFIIAVETSVTSGFAEEPHKNTINKEVTIETIDSDQLVVQFLKNNPSAVEEIVLKRKQRTGK